MMRTLCALSLGLGLLIAVSGCPQHQNPSPDTQVTIPATPPTAAELNGQITTDVKYYLEIYQTAPANGHFDAGTKVKILMKGPSYTLVMTTDGSHGWVAKDSVKDLVATTQPSTTHGM